jgi:hypothetical protein
MGKATRSSSTGSATASSGDANKPAHTIRYRNLKATIWKNVGDKGEFYSVTLSRSYQDKEEQWHDANSFNTADLPTVAKLCNDAHSWITWQERRTREEVEGKSTGGRR